MPTLYVVAGPNGAGKSTLTRQDRFAGARIVDPDAIARRIAPDDPEGAALAAGRQASRERRAAIAAGESLVVETTLSGASELRLMDEARAAGHRVELHYISVESVEQNIARVRCRVAQGGHHVPEEDVRRRFERSRANLPGAIARSDEARLYDNNDSKTSHRLAIVVARGAAPRLIDPCPDWAVEAVRAAALLARP